MRKIAYITLLLLSVLSCRKEESLRVMSYNIRFITPKDSADLSWDNRKEANLAMLRSVSPDVVGLQEAVKGIASYLEENLPEYELFESSIDSVTLTGNGIMWKRSRFECLSRGVFFLGEDPSAAVPSWDSKHIRSTQWVKLRSRDGREFFIFNTHLDHRGNLAKKNGVLLNLSVIDSLAAGYPVFLTGDMNIREGYPDEPFLEPFYTYFKDARRSAAVSSSAVSFTDYGKGKHPVGNLDHIFYRDATALEFTVRDESYGVPYISDHYPIVCDFEWTSDASCPDVTAAQELASRILPRNWKDISFKVVPAATDYYSLKSVGKKVCITGNNANSLAVGLNAYLKDYCNISVSWFPEHDIPQPRHLPCVPSPVVRRALVPQRFFLNYCTFGYTMNWWKWEHWERLIDWMALNGVNMALATTGQESVWRDVWREMGLSEEEISAYFPGPSYLPWHRMSNVDGWHGPLPESWLTGQEKLQKRIIERELSLGITPVLSAFNGHVPASLKEHYPSADIHPLNAWGNFSSDYNPWYLNPADPLFSIIQKAYLRRQKEVYGEANHVYGVDLFNEVNPPSWEPSYLSSVASATFESMAEVDPEAVWLQMGWLFWHGRNNWTPERIDAYISAVPKGRLILLDYYCDKTEVYRATEGFHGQDFIWCYLGNFGGNTMIAGNFADVSSKLDALLSSRPSSLTGLGCTLEGLDVNQPMYEYVLDRAWEQVLTDDQWVERLAARRFGSSNALYGAAWNVMAKKVQKHIGSHWISQIPMRPNLDGYTKYARFERSYENRDLLTAWGLLIDAGESSRSAARFDAVNMARQCLDNYFTDLYHEFLETRNSAVGARILEILRDMDRLCASEPTFLLGKWIADARDWGKTPSEKNYYEQDARNILSCWGEPGRCRYIDYAGRDWNGLIGSYYYPRWEKFVSQMCDGTFDPASFAAWAADFEGTWMQSTDAFLSEPSGNAYELSRELYFKYRDLIGIPSLEFPDIERVSWLDSAVIYHIYPPSFQDSDGDGTGDLEGIRSRLSYIKETGFNTIWISPVFSSEFEDGGYDITDYYSIDPRYGTNATLERLVSEAHSMGIRVCLDLVAGHSSSKHPWFQAARKGVPPYKDYYIWAGCADSPGNKWVKDSPGRWYLKNYYDIQPAFNYGYLSPANPWEQPVDGAGPLAVRKELKKIIGFWFDKGVDGFRCDMANSLVKGDDEVYSGNKALWRDIISWSRERYPDRIFISEWSEPLNSIPAGFDIDIVRHKGDGEIMYRDIAHNTERHAVNGEYPSRSCWLSLEGNGQFASFSEPYSRILAALRGHGYATVPTSSHDTWRLNRFGRSSAGELKTALTLFLTMPWVPIVYYGEEIGMRSMDGAPPKEGSRERSAQRTPMQWDDAPSAGFSSAPPSELYLPVDTSATRPSVASQIQDSTSIYSWVKGLIALRQRTPALGTSGSWEVLTPATEPYPVVYERSFEGQHYLVVLNPSGRRAQASIPYRGPVSPVYGEASAVKVSCHKDRTVLDVQPQSAVILREKREPVRILGVGNSWTRDSMRWLSAIAASAGRDVVVGHAYLGGSTLEDQFLGISDTTFTYTHAGQEQVVHNTYQYWKYTCSEDPVKTPSAGYRNGLAGIGVTLESVVRDEPWDWIVLQPEATFGNYHFNISRLEEAIKEMMAPEVAKAVKTALMVPFAYPEGNTDYRQAFADAYNDGVMPSSQAQWDSLYTVQYELIQKAAAGSGYKLVNVGKAIHAAREQPELSRCGYLLQRSPSNTHLAEGLPMYIASLAYAYSLLGLTPEDVRFYPLSSADSIITGDRGESVSTAFILTPELARQAKTLTFNAIR